MTNEQIIFEPKRKAVGSNYLACPTCGLGTILYITEEDGKIYYQYPIPDKVDADTCLPYAVKKRKSNSDNKYRYMKDNINKLVCHPCKKEVTKLKATMGYIADIPDGEWKEKSDGSN